MQQHVDNYGNNDEPQTSVAPALEPRGPSIVPGADLNIPEKRVERTFGEDVSVFDSILNAKDLGEPVRDTWYFKRMDIKIPIRSLTSDELKKARDRNTTPRRIGRSDRIHTDLDMDRYNIDLVTIACLDPNFNDAGVRAALAQKLNCGNDARTLVTKVFLPGEIAMMVVKILELSGFEDDDEADIDSLKD